MHRDAVIILLHDRACNIDLPAVQQSEIPRDGGGIDADGQCALHIDGPAAVHVTVCDLAGERGIGPPVLVDHVDGVHMPVEQDRGRSRADGSDHIAGAVGLYVIKAQFTQLFFDSGGDGRFLSGHAPDRYELPDER